MPANDQERLAIQINLANALAEHALIDKTDKQGKPLIEHSRRVAEKVKHLSHEQHIAALLHDTVEETTNDPFPGPITISIIDALFGRSVGNMVELLTRTYRADLSYQAHVEMIALYPHARAIKLADLNDNLDSSRGPIQSSLKSRYERARQLLIDQDEYERQVREGNPSAVNPHPQAKGQ